MAKEIYEKRFSELKDEEIYSVVKQWFDGIQPMRGYPSFLVIIISLAVFAIVMHYFGIIIALIIASILPFAFGYRKAKPKIIKEEPPESDVDAPEFRGCLTIQNPSKNMEIIGL